MVAYRVAACRRLASPSLILVAAMLSACGPDYNSQGHIVSASGVKATRYVVYPDGRELDLLSPSAARSFVMATGVFQGRVDQGMIAWQIEYADLTQHNGRGFDDPLLGPARRAAFEATLGDIGSKLGLDRKRQLDVIVQPSLADSANPKLAEAGTFYPDHPKGFFTGHALSRLTMGVDPDVRPTELDVHVTVNFGHDYHLGAGPPPADRFDFRSIVLHEVTHGLGFASRAAADGTAGGVNPGRHSSYDAHLQRANGTALFVGEGQFVGTPTDLAGPPGGLHWSGPAVAQAACGGTAEIYAPPTFQPGSSLSHVTFDYPRAVMAAGALRGVANRDYTRVERSILRDLGLPFVGIGASAGPVYCPKATFQPGGVVQASAVGPLDDRPGDDLAMVVQRPAGSQLIIFSGLDPAAGYTFDLPNLSYFEIALAELGPEYQPGIALAETGGASILSLAGLKLPPDRRVLRSEDFAFVSRAAASTAGTGTAWINHEPSLALGKTTSVGGKSAVLMLGQKGLLSFLDDGFGGFDGLQAERSIAELRPPHLPVRDLAPFRHGGPLTVDMPFGLGSNPPIVSAVNGTIGPRTVTSWTYRSITALGREGLVALAALRAAGDDDLALLRERPDLNFTMEKRWADVGQIGDVNVDGLSETGYFIETDRHALSRLSLNTHVIERLVGGAAGHVDGPLATARFNSPTAMCRSGRVIYLVDSGNKVVRSVDLDRGIVSTVAGQAGVSGTTDGARGRATFEFSPGGLSRHGCAVSGESLYVLDGFDAQGRAGRLRKVNLRTGYVVTPEYYDHGEIVTALADEGGAVYLLKGYDAERSVLAREPTVPSGMALPASLVRLADLNGDGFDDAVVMPDSAVQYRTIYVFENMRNNKFRLAWNQTIDANPQNVEVRDANGDGRADIVAILPQEVRLFSNQGNWQFGESLNWRLKLDRPILFGRMRELNGNGPDDVALVDDTGRLSLFYTDPAQGWAGGSGPLGAAKVSEISDAGSLIWFDLKDFDGNGLVDLVGYDKARNAVRILEARFP